MQPVESPELLELRVREAEREAYITVLEQQLASLCSGEEDRLSKCVTNLLGRLQEVRKQRAESDRRHDLAYYKKYGVWEGECMNDCPKCCFQTKWARQGAMSAAKLDELTTRLMTELPAMSTEQMMYFKEQNQCDVMRMQEEISVRDSLNIAVEKKIADAQ